MLRARARVPGPLIGPPRVGQLGARLRHGARAIQLPKLDRVVVQDLHALRSALRGGLVIIAGEDLLMPHPSHRPALEVVTVEQRRRRRARVHRGQLPRQVVRVVNAGVGAVTLMHAAREVRLERRAKEHAANGAHVASTPLLDPERLAQRALAAVSGEQVRGTERVHAPLALALAHDRRHAARILFEAHELGAHAQLGAELARLVAQHRLDHVLRDGRAEVRRKLLGRDVRLGRRPIGLFQPPAGQALDARAHQSKVARHLGDVRAQAHRAQQLERARRVTDRARTARAAGVTFHQDRGHAVLREKQGRGRADEAASDDQHVG
jgi:hypothetical protein